MTDQRIKISTLAAFVMPCLPLAAVGLPLVVYLPKYYATTLGLDLASVGLLFTMIRLIDVPLDPIFGHLLDRTKTRFGRFRLWIAASAVAMWFGVWMVFMAEPGISITLAFTGLLLMYIGYSTLQVAHNAWGASLTDSYHERSRLFGLWQMANVGGMLLMLMLPPLVAALTTDADGSIGIHTMGWLVIILLPAATLLIVSVVGERAELGNRSHRYSDMIQVLRIPIFQRYLLADLLASLAPGITGALFLFYFEAALGYGFVDAGLFLLVYFCAGLAAVPGWLWLSRRTSKHVALAGSLVTFGVMQLSTIFLTSGNFMQTAIGIGIAGIPYAAPTLLLRAMLADLSDAETLRTGQERAGLFYAMTIAVNKLGYAIPVGVLFPLLVAIGFAADKGTANSASALQGLTMLFSVPPALLAVAAAALVLRWPIDAAVQAKVAQSLAEKA